MTTTYSLLDEAIGAARRLIPDATEDAQADLAMKILAAVPARIFPGVVQVRRMGPDDGWRTVDYIHPETVPQLNAEAGWPQYRVVEIGMCP